MLSYNSTLSKISLRANSLGDQFAEDLIPALLIVQSVEQLMLDQNLISVRLLKRIKELLQRNRHLKAQKSLPKLKKELKASKLQEAQIDRIQDTFKKQQAAKAEDELRPAKDRKRLKAKQAEEDSKMQVLRDELAQHRAVTRERDASLREHLLELQQTTAANERTLRQMTRQLEEVNAALYTLGRKSKL